MAKDFQWTKTDFNGHRVLVADLSKLPGGYTPFEQVWVNGHRAIQARTPNSGYFRTPFDETQIKSMTQGLRGQMEGFLTMRMMSFTLTALRMVSLSPSTNGWSSTSPLIVSTETTKRLYSPVRHASRGNQ